MLDRAEEVTAIGRYTTNKLQTHHSRAHRANQETIEGSMGLQVTTFSGRLSLIDGDLARGGR